jgi:hypothetical protein
MVRILSGRDHRGKRPKYQLLASAPFPLAGKSHAYEVSHRCRSSGQLSGEGCRGNISEAAL